ncbi:MAG: MATE family efflux transporter [Planctomycetota bacterium]
MSDTPVKGDLNRGPVLIRLGIFGLPLVLGMFFHGLFNLADLIIVGKLGDWALAAVNTAGILLMVPMLISTGINNSSIAVVSRNYGMRNYRRANAYTLQSFLLLGFMALVLGVPCYVYADQLNVLIGAQGKQVGPAGEYLRISAAGIITMFWLMQVTAVLRAGGNARWPMILMIGSNVANVLLSWGLVHGVWGFPKLGVPGAAWGTVIARAIFMMFGLYLITRPTSPVKLILRGFKLRPRMLWNLTRIGIPSSLQFVVRVLAYMAILRLVTNFGEAVAVHAALAVGFRLDMLATFTGAGWGAGAAAMVGQGLGAGLRDRAAHAGWSAAALNAVMMWGIGALFYVYAPALVAAFGKDPDIDPEFTRMHELGVEYLRIAVFGYGFAGIGITIAQALGGAGSTKTPLFLDTLCFLAIQVPIAYYLVTFQTERGFERHHLWWSLVGVTAFAALLYTWVWMRGAWKDKQIH